MHASGGVHDHETGGVIGEHGHTHGHLKRTVGFWGLMFVSLGSIIGSGWLLSALTASETAGPAAILSWALAARHAHRLGAGLRRTRGDVSRRRGNRTIPLLFARTARRFRRWLVVLAAGGPDRADRGAGGDRVREQPQPGYKRTST